MKSRNHYQRALKVAGQGTFLAAVLGFGTLAHGQGYSTTFNQNDYTRNDSLSGQQNWDTNDPYNGAAAPTTSANNPGSTIGQTDDVVNQQPPGVSATDYYAAIGGLLQGNEIPGQSTVQLFHAANVQGAASFTVNSDAFLTASVAAYPSNDTFGYSFLNAGGNSLFSVNFVPLSRPTTMSPATLATDSITYTVNGVTSTLASGVLQLNGYFHISVSVVGGATPTLSFTVTEPGTTGTGATVTGVALTAADATTVTNVGTTWALANTTADANGGYENAGSNTLYFKNLMVAVPEPSTYVMLGLGVLGLAMRFRRKAQV